MKKSHVQMTEPLQTSSACHTNGARAVGTQMDVHVLITKNRAWMHFASLVAAVAAMYSASHDD